MTEEALTLLHASQSSDKAETWIEYLHRRIDLSWRPGEFNSDTWDFVPDASNPLTRLNVCAKEGCGIIISSRFCPACRGEYDKLRLANDDFDEEGWIKTPRPRAQKDTSCLFDICGRRARALGLCYGHYSTYRSARDSRGGNPDFTVDRWMEIYEPRKLSTFGQLCGWPSCRWEPENSWGVCNAHHQAFDSWKRRNQKLESTVAEWLLATDPEPYLEPQTFLTYASKAAFGLRLLQEPVRSEFLLALQLRDKEGLGRFRAEDYRRIFLAVRAQGAMTLVGAKELGVDTRSTDRLGILRTMQRAVDKAHREWSGVDPRDPRIVYMGELELTRSSRPFGPTARIDFRDVEQDWVAETAIAWARTGVRGADQVSQVGYVTKLLSEVITRRGTPRHALGAADMDAVVNAIRERWPVEKTQTRALRALAILIAFGRRNDMLSVHWATVPARFELVPEKHAPRGGAGSSGSDEDEPYRFIPQPIVDWLMDHLHLIERSSDYATAEAKVLIYVHERCGRRTGETLRLADNCLSYDSSGAPYLEWVQGKRPWKQGKRLPIDQETHDAIKEWQGVKAVHGVKSRWLFPSWRGTKDRHYGQQYLGRRLKDFIAAVKEKAPFQGPVEGPEGNLIHFDLDSIDPYAFRHAFAQRWADATDENGHLTTESLVLKELMGHASVETASVYFEVTARRRRKALASIPPRRINTSGQVISVDPERSAFNKVAVRLGSCLEPQNIAAGGKGCMMNYACESCPFFIVDPLERDGMVAKRRHLKVQLERAKAINAKQHTLDHLQGRVDDCQLIIETIDKYVAQLPEDEKQLIDKALTSMEEIRSRASAPRKIDLRPVLLGAA